MTPTAVLFDIDGTLVDSNYAHVAAWSRALDEIGHPVASWRIHRAIGMDSALIIDELLGGSADELGDHASGLHSDYYLAAAGALRAFPHATDLVDEVAGRGMTTVLATSAPADELQLLRSVLGVDEAVDLVTAAGDVERAKPAPDIVQVALERAAVDPADAIMVGDSVWDIRAAAAAGVSCIALLSGGTGRLELLEAGAAAVYDDVGDLLVQLDDSPIGALAH